MHLQVMYGRLFQDIYQNNQLLVHREQQFLPYLRLSNLHGCADVFPSPHLFRRQGRSEGGPEVLMLLTSKLLYEATEVKADNKLACHKHNRSGWQTCLIGVTPLSWQQPMLSSVLDPDARS